MGLLLMYAMDRNKPLRTLMHAHLCYHYLKNHFTNPNACLILALSAGNTDGGRERQASREHPDGRTFML